MNFDIINTVAGNGLNGFSGDGGLATKATITLVMLTWVPMAVSISNAVFSCKIRFMINTAA
jgi:hypothetical protein